MSDITEALIDYLETNTNLTGVHVGEVVPQGEEFPFVWLARSGEVLSEELCHPPSIESVLVDIEVVSDDIDESRTLANEVKNHLRVCALHSLNYTNEAGETQTIHGFAVEDHDDSYLPRNLSDDARIHIGALNATILLGE